MPSVYPRNISTHQATARSNAGLTRQSQYRTNNNSHPSFGGSHGYPLWLRREVMQYEAVHGVNYVVEQFNISSATIYCWRQRIDPFQQTGNHERREMTGIDLLLLAMCLFLFPRVGSDEIATFIFVNGGSAGIARETISK